MLGLRLSGIINPPARAGLPLSHQPNNEETPWNTDNSAAPASEGLRHRLRLLGNQRHLRPDRRGAVRSARCTVRSMPASTASTPPKPMAWAFPSRRWRGRSGARRRDVCLVTKFGVGYPEAPNRRDSSRARIMASIEQSLRNLEHRSRRRLSGALARPEHAVRGNHARRSTTSCGRARRATSACPISARRSSKPA